MRHPSPLTELIQQFRQLPGFTGKAAERAVLAIAQWPEEKLHAFSLAISHLPEKLSFCPTCGCLQEKIDTERSCALCSPERALTKTLCVVASWHEVPLIESAHNFYGLYHVLGGLIYPLEEKTIEMHAIKKLRDRVIEAAIEEVLLALDATFEGDATALYIKRELISLPCRLSRLAFGVPLGSSIEYVDSPTLARAVAARLPF